MTNNKKDIEKKTANKFSSITSHAQKKEYVKGLPKNINVSKVQNYFLTDSDKVEFLRLFYGKEKLFNKGLRSYKKKRNEIIRKLKSAKGNYKIAKFFLNPLRKSGETLLRKEALELASQNNKTRKNFFDKIKQAENLVSIVKENDYNTEILKNLLTKNLNSVKTNDIILENLKDLFEHDNSLDKLQDDFNNFLINYVENIKPINKVISEAEERILSGDTTNAYLEIEKTEKLISLNVGLALVNVYNSIQVMNAKKDFVKFIKDTERLSISQDSIEHLVTKADEYRNVDIPKKWSEMKHKIKFTNDFGHFNAWYYGFQQGRYKSVVVNVKEHIVKELIKKILNKIINKFNNIDIKSLNLLSLLESKKDSTEDIKIAFKKFFKIPDIKKASDDELLKQFETFMIYYFYLNYDLHEEKEIVKKTLQELSGCNNFKEKIDYLIKSRQNTKNSIKDDNFKIAISNIFDKLINLYNILLEKNKEKQGLDEFKEDEANETIEFLDNISLEIEKNKKVNDLSNRISALPDEISLDVMSILNFDQRFEKYFPEVEDALYQKDWGKTLGIIGLKVKEIEKKLGMLASEQYLEDIGNRIAIKLGEDAFIVKKIRNMKENLIKIHAQGTKKLHYLQERLAKAKTSTGKILELQKISIDPKFIGIFGTIQNMERILIRDKFEEIYKKAQNLPIDTQKALFEGLQDDLKVLLRYEPNTIKKVTNYIEEINLIINNSMQNIPKIDENLGEAIQNFENGDLPLVDLADILCMDYPSSDKYNPKKIEDDIKSIKHDVNKGKMEADDLESIINEINNDISFFKINGSDDTIALIEEANTFIDALDQNIEQVKKIDNLKKTKNIENAVKKIMKNDSIDIIDQIDMLENVFKGKNLSLRAKEKGFLVAEKTTKNKETKTKLAEIVEVIRRMEKEIEPLITLENKIAKLNNWISNEYIDKEHIKEFLKNQMKEYALLRGREGGLLRKLLDGLDQAKDKIKYLKGMMKDVEYQHLIPTIKTLLKNIKDELQIKIDRIDKEWIKNNLEGKKNDEKLDWLKIRKYWHKYDKYQDFINEEIKKTEDCITKTPDETEKIYSNIIDLAQAVLLIEGQGARQSFIKKQNDKDKNADINFKSQKKLLFYLFSTNSNEPGERLKALTNRVTLPISDKKKYLQLLKKSDVMNMGSLKEFFGITDEDIAFYATYILYFDKSLDIRIKYLKRFKDSDNTKTETYKEFFEITDKTISDVIKFLETKISKKIESKVGEEFEEKAGVKEEAVRELGEKIEIGKKDIEQKEQIEAFSNAKSPAEKDIPEISKASLDKSMEFEDSSAEVFKEEDIKEWEEKSEDSNVKTTKEIIKEQKFHKEYEKKEEIAKHIETLSTKTDKETLKKISEKAHQIYKDKTKETEGKISDLLVYLTTCFPEAVSRIITTEILPIFRGEGLNLDVYNLMQSINDSIFKPALQGENVEKNITFYEKKLNTENILNIKTIIKRINDLWAKEAKIIENQEENFKNVLEDINQGKGITSFIIYLNNIYPENILSKIKENLNRNIANDQIKNNLNMIYKALQDVYKNGSLNMAEKTFLHNTLSLNTKDQAIFENLIEKIKNIRDEEKKEYIEKTVSPKDKVKTETDLLKKTKKIENEKHDSIDESSSMDIDTDIKKELTISPEIEKALMGIKNFIKPHANILEVIRQNDNLEEKNFDVDTRREIIKKLYDDGKIFTYNGTSYIGKGQINNVVKNNMIFKDERTIFVIKLDAFLEKFTSQEEKFNFLGIADEMEYRKLNYMLDKYNLNRNMYSESSGKKVAPSLKHAPKPSKTMPQKIEEKKGAEQHKEDFIKKDDKKTTKKAFADLYKAKLKKQQEQEKKSKLSLSEIKKKEQEFINKSQNELLKEAAKEINKKLERLIKSATTSNDLEAIYRNYFGTNDLNKRNQLQLCYDIKQIANIISKDKNLFSKLSFDMNKLKKIYDSKKKKIT